MIYNLLQFIGQPDFQIAFWSSIFSTGIIALITALYVNFFTPLFKTPELSLVVKQDGVYVNKIKISKREDGDYETSFRLAIKNGGNKTFKANHGYWHLYFPVTEKIEGFGDASPLVVPGENGHLRDVINLSVYPKSFLDFGPEYKLLIKKERIGSVSIRYFFETDYGYFPKTINLNQKTGLVLFTDMGLIELDLL